MHSPEGMQAPVVLPAIAFLVGVLAGVRAPSDPHWVALGLAGAWLVAAFAWWRRRPRLALAAIVAGFFAAGSLNGLVAARKVFDSPLRAAAERAGALVGPRREPVLLEGRLREDAAPTPYGAAFDLEVSSLARLGAPGVPLRGRVRLSVGGSRIAEHIGAWRAGRLVRVTATLGRPLAYRNPGIPDQERLLALRGIHLLGSVKSALLVQILEPAGPFTEAASAARAWIRRAVREAVAPHSSLSSGIVTAILIGDRAGLDEATERRLQRAGTYHVIAISGGNIAIFTALVLAAAAAAGAAPGTASLLTILVLLVYAAIVEGGPSVARATFVATVYLFARVLDHRTAPVNALALTALLVLVASPLAVFDVGFVLTFGAALALVVGVPRAMGRLGWGRRSRLGAVAGGAVAILMATLVVELALLPVTATVFSLVTLAGFVLNFAAIPLMTAVQVLGLVTCGLAVLAPSFARGPGYLAHLAASGLVESARLVDLAPWFAWRVPPPAPGVLTAYYAGLAGWWLAGSRPFARRLAAAGGAAALAWIVTAPPLGWVDPGRGRLRVSVLDVGQGDAVLVRLAGGRAWLIDAGGPVGSREFGERILARALWALGVRRLDTVVLTHGDPDHLLGALAVVRQFRPREVWEGVPVPPHPALREVAREADRVGAVWRTVQRGDRLRIGPVEVRVLHPPPPQWERQRVRNDDSIVIALRYGRVAVLLPGDIGRAIEDELVAEGLFDAPDEPLVWVVKVPHHGSAGSSGPALIAATRPRAAIVSAGRDNVFGHPARIVLERYRRAGAAVYRTDRDGAVHVDTDGRALVIRTETGRQMQLRAP